VLELLRLIQNRKRLLADFVVAASFAFQLGLGSLRSNQREEWELVEKWDEEELVR